LTNLLEIRDNQLVAALSVPRMHLRSRLENQIAMCIERTDKAFFVGWFHTLQRIDGDKGRIFDRGIISQEAYRLRGSVTASTVIRKLQGARLHQAGRRDTVAALEIAISLPNKAADCSAALYIRPSSSVSSVAIGSRRELEADATMVFIASFEASAFDTTLIADTGFMYRACVAHELFLSFAF
jgi:hypothetical protein